MGEIGKVLFGAVAAYAVVVLAVYVFQRNLMYVPDARQPSRVRAGVPDMETVEMTTEDGLSLTAWYQAARPGQPTLVYFHGNAGNIEGRGGKVQPYLEQGVGVLLVEYRGYGGNPGAPTEAGLYADGRAALAFLADRGVEPADVVLYGESLGTGIAVKMAAEGAGKGRPVRGLVLEAPFTSMAEAAQVHYPYLPARWLVKDRYDSRSRIAKVNTPLLIVHGEADRVVPVDQGRALLAAAAEPKAGLFLPGGGHVDLEGLGLTDHVLAFLKGLS